MNLRLSGLKLRAIVVLVVSRMDGITLVFKNDPLESVSVSSTFDSVAAIQAFVQKEIEGQLRELFRSDLPSIVHKLSQEFVKGEVRNAAKSASGGFASGAKIHTHSAFSRPSTSQTGSLSRGFSTFSLHEQAYLPAEAVQDEPSPPIESPSSRNAFPGFSRSASVPDGIASYDPTYGLRPEHPPLTGRLDSYRRLVKHAGRGLGAALSDVQEDEAGLGTEEAGPDDSMRLNVTDASIDRGEGPSSRPYGDHPAFSSTHSASGFAPSISDAPPTESDVTMETIRAVGGGTVTRPRILHSQSEAALPGPGSGIAGSTTSVSGATATLRPRVSSSTMRERARIAGMDRSVSMTAPPSAFSGIGAGEGQDTLRRRRLDRYAVSTDPLEDPRRQHHRPRSQVAPSSYAPSVGLRSSSSYFPRTHTGAASSSSGSKSTRPTSLDTTASARLIEKSDSRRFDSIASLGVGGRPSSPDRLDPSDASDPRLSTFDPSSGSLRGSESCHLLATLAVSNHTLSPFGRALNHVASRSTPPISRQSSTVGAGVLRKASQGSGLPNDPTRLPSRVTKPHDVNPPPIEARRKRLFKIGGSDQQAVKAHRRGGARTRGKASSGWPSPDLPEEDGDGSGSDYSSYFPRQRAP